MIRRDHFGAPVNPFLRWLRDYSFEIAFGGFFLLIVGGIVFLARWDMAREARLAGAAEVFGKYRARLDNGGRLTAAEEEEYARALAVLNARGSAGRSPVVVPVPIRVGK